MSTLECSETRRIVRDYIKMYIENGQVNKFIDVAIWIPSGNNGQS